MSAVVGPGARDDTRVRVIVVHGIGNQRVGATAARWSDSFVRFGRAAGYVPEVSAAMLTDDPSRVTVRLTGPHRVPFRNRTIEIAVDEAHWAESFAEPTLGRVLRFLVTVAPVLAITQTISLWRARRGTGRSRPAARSLARAATVVGPLGVGIVLLGLAAPLVAVLLLLLLVGSALPIPAVRRSVGRVLGWLSASIGDAYLFVADPVSRAAMESRLAERLAERSPSPAYRTVVLAHSQGAALAYRALARLGTTQRPTSFVTVGSGVGRLREVGLLQTIPWYVTPLFVAVVACAGAGIAVWEPGPTTLLVLAAALFTAVAWDVCRIWLDSGTEDDRLPPPLAGTTWLDIAAGLDPVPNGPATTDAGAQGRYQFALVAGEMSVVRDHVRYDLDWDQTLPLVLARILDPAASRPLGYVGVRPDRSGGRLSHPWAARDWWGLALRAVPLAVAVVALRMTDLFRLGQWLRTAPPGFLDSSVGAVFVPLRGLSDLLDHPVFRSPGPQTLLGIAAVLALGVGGSVLTRRLLTFFQRRETVRWLHAGGMHLGGRARREGRWPRWRWPASLLGVALAAALVPALLLVWDQRVRWTQEQAVEAYLRAVAEDDVHAQCSMTARPDDGDGLLDPCGTAEEERLRTCSDARSAVAALPDDAVSIEDTRVAIDWAPEVPPACDDPDRPLLLPTRLERVDGDWVVAEVGPPELEEDRPAEE